MCSQVPEKLAAHAYKICHWNPEGYVQRDSVSCRKEHRNSPMGRFKAGFHHKTGNPIARDGFIVPCKRNSDCYTRCPAHPLTGDRYQCQKNYKLYDVPLTGNEGEIHLIDLDRGPGKVFDPDPFEQAITGEWGICVDVDSSFNQGCPDQTMSAVVDGIIGCLDRRVSIYLCGLEVDISDGDSSTAAIEGNFLYMPPRVLVAAGEDLDGDGQVSPAITCGDPVDCMNKCRYLERNSLHGAGAPPACALYAAAPPTTPGPVLHRHGLCLRTKIGYSIVGFVLVYVTNCLVCHVRRCDQYCSNNIVSFPHHLIDGSRRHVSNQVTVSRLQP